MTLEDGFKNTIMEKETAIKLNEPLTYMNGKKKRSSYEHNGNHYLPLNLENELIEMGIDYEISEYEIVNFEDENFE